MSKALPLSKPTDTNKPRSRIQSIKLQPPEMTNLEYQDGGQSPFRLYRYVTRTNVPFFDHY